MPSALDNAEIATRRVRGDSRRRERLHVELAVVEHRDDAQRRALLGTQHVPRHDVRVVLDGRDQDLVARADVGAAPGLSHEVDALGGVPREDQLARLGRADEARDLGPGRLEQVGCPAAQIVDTAMDVGVARGVVLGERVEHHLRLLGRGRVVEVDERLAVRRRAQNRKVGPHGRDIERGGCRHDYLH